MTLGVVRRARSGERWRTVSSEHGCHSPHVPHGKESCPILNKGDMEPVGLNEYDLYRDLENGYCSSSVSQRVDLAVICSVKDMAHIRTIYLKPVYRS